MPVMRIVNRIISLALLLVLTSLVAGCSSINIPSWDPTDLLDFLDTKKKAPGERHPVFPGGVPGVAQGVPPDLVKGTPEHAAAMATADPSLAPPPTDTPVEPEKPTKKRVAAKPTRVTVTPKEPGPNGEDAADTEQPPPASPPPPRKRAAKKPAADPSAPQDQSQAQPQQNQSTLSSAPTVPSGSFQR
jgi:hypothetical protein